MNDDVYDEYVDEAKLEEILAACRRGDYQPWGSLKMRAKPDLQSYTFPGFGGERFPNLMLRGAGDLDNWKRSNYEQKHEGYLALKKALEMEPVAVTGEVKASQLRGRGARASSRA